LFQISGDSFHVRTGFLSQIPQGQAAYPVGFFGEMRDLILGVSPPPLPGPGSNKYIKPAPDAVPVNIAYCLFMTFSQAREELVKTPVGFRLSNEIP
jgi:hypothetical protein